VDEHGFITEGAGSAFFAIFGQAVRTAPLTANILASITREYVIKAARNIGMLVQEKSLTPAEAVRADELFIAVTTQDIVPVVRFDGRPIGDGKVGRHTKLLSAEFHSFT